MPLQERPEPHEHCTRSAAEQVSTGHRLAREGRFAEARPYYERALEFDSRNVSAHAALYEIALVQGERAVALEHQSRMLAQRRFFVERAPAEKRRLLVLLAPGDFQANVPIDFLIDRTTTSLHKFYFTGSTDEDDVALPPSDAVFTAIAHSEENMPRLKAARDLVARLGLPVINHPDDVMNTERVRVWERVRDLPGVVMPCTQRFTRASLEHEASAIAYPIVIRPLDSQAGADLAMLENAHDLTAYLARVPAPGYYVMPFVDYRSADGYYRKYRISIVDGRPYPFHLGISPHWMVHYYTSQTPETPWMRDEERLFLEQFDSVFPERLQDALGSIAGALQLQYCSVDCAIDREGRLVLFEADPAMIIHGMDRSGTFSYRLAHALQIFNAFERLIDRARSR